MWCEYRAGVSLLAMNVVIRRAEERDVPQMLALVKELAVFERAPDEVTVTEAHMRDGGFGADPVWVGWVAEVRSDNETIRRSENESAPSHPLTSRGSAKRSPSYGIVGMAVCYERYSTWKGRRLYLEDIIVTESARGQRIGEKLFMECVRYAVAQNHSGMLWQVLDWNTDAIRFYDRFGAKYSSEWLNGSLELEQLMKLNGGSGVI